MQYTKICRGYCPEFEKIMDVAVNFSEVSILGSEPQFRQFSFVCDYEENCLASGPSGLECPIFKNATY